MDLLAQILSSRVRARIFGLLHDPGDQEYHLREIARRSGLALRTIQQDLKKLLKLDLVCARRDGNRLYFRANIDHPVFPEIQKLVQKTTGAIPLLRKALADRKNISTAFVFGSLARQEEQAQSDIDLLVIGEIGLRSLTSLLSSVEKAVQREINPHIMKGDDFKERKRKGDHFVKRVLESPRIFIVGGERDLETMG